MASFPLEIWHSIFAELRTADDPRGATRALQQLALTCQTFRPLAQAQLFRTLTVATCRVDKFGRAVRLSDAQYRRAASRLELVCDPGHRLLRTVEECRFAPRTTPAEFLDGPDWHPDDPYTAQLLNAFFSDILPRLPGLKQLSLSGVLLCNLHVRALLHASAPRLTVEACAVPLMTPGAARSETMGVSRLVLGSSQKCGVPAGGLLLVDLYIPSPDPRTLQSLSCTGRTEQASLLHLLDTAWSFEALRSVELYDGEHCKLEPGATPLQDWRPFLAERCPRLEELTVHAAVQDGFANPHPRAIPSLKAFRASWGGCAKLYLDAHHPNLRHIALEGDPLASECRLPVEDRHAVGAELRSIEGACAGLKALTVSIDARSRYRFSSRDLIQVCERCPSLKHLRIEARPAFLSIKKVLHMLCKSPYPFSLQTFVFEPRLVLSTEEERTLVDEIPTLAAHLRTSSPNLNCVVVAYSALGDNKLRARHVAFNAGTGERLRFIPDDRNIWQLSIC